MIRFPSRPAGRFSAVNSAADRFVHIVGAGVAGCAAASTALELGYRVTIYEAGPGGALPAELRSADLNRAAGAQDRWWPGDYMAGRGLGGGSAVNGMVVQIPDQADELHRWAWECFNPTLATPGPLGQGVLESAGHNAQVAQLSVRNGFRQTAADVWLQPSHRLTVVTDTAISSVDVTDWLAEGRQVLVAAGALASPELVAAEPRAALDHPSVVIGFEVPEHLQTLTVDQPVITVIVRWGDCQAVLLERAGVDRSRGALMVSGMTGQQLEPLQIEAALELLRSIGIDGTVDDAPAPVAHACCNLTGVATRAPVVDASTLPALPSVNPMVTVAAHARRTTLQALT